MKWWSDDKAEGQKIRTAIVALHEGFHADVVQPYLAAWRQYVYRLSIALLTRARRAAADERRRLNSLNYGDLLNLTARVLRENVGVRTGAPAEVPASVRGRVPGHRSRAGRDRLLAGRGDRRRGYRR